MRYRAADNKSLRARLLCIRETSGILNLESPHWKLYWHTRDRRVYMNVTFSVISSFALIFTSIVCIAYELRRWKRVSGAA